MKRFLGVSIAIALATAIALPASAADLPEVKISPSNKVPACATPGRMMAYLHARNPSADSRYNDLATQYMRMGEELGIRWDMAFFQMILETGALSYTGDVRASQNNFAGLGAAGGGKRGEHFSDISSGVKAHLQHLLMYAGEHIDNPVAERTRKVQEWGVLTDWQNSISGPMTYALVAQQWAPGSRGYVRDIATIADGFYDSYCNAPDPRPELVQEARRGRAAPQDTQVAEFIPDPNAGKIPAAATTSTTAPEPDAGAQIAQRAIEEARSENPDRAGLGAPGVMLDGVAAKAQAAVGQQTAAAASTAEQRATKPAAQAAVTLINPSTPDKPADAGNGAKSTAAAAQETNPAQTAAAPKADQPAKTDKPAATAKAATIQTASVAGAATQLNVPEAKAQAQPAPAKCKVWTASYGGQRAILIKVATEGTVNYTVLDVNAASEKREVDAYIAAYAKGGERMASFASQAQALDKAFELCPEG